MVLRSLLSPSRRRRALHSFPTRRSSDLGDELADEAIAAEAFHVVARDEPSHRVRDDVDLDRKSTRLNSSHSQISYAVFCLKKKSNVKWEAETRIISS